MKIVPVPCRSDNYMYLLIPSDGSAAAVVDPYDPKKIIAAAEKEGVKIGQQVITTHHHDDHAGGNNEFAKHFSGVKIYGGSKQCQGLTDEIKHGETFNVGSIKVTGHATPCHTQDSICFFVEENGERAAFCGDTLFHGGCGRFFEGTPAEMHKALNTTLRALPEDTVVYPGHEYTKANVAFGAHVDPHNQAIKSLQAFCEKNEVTTGKFTIGDELQHNVFMRLGSDAVRQATGQSDPVEAMGKLREMKNNFKGR